jgi:F-type H+-transporting ATPase subunit a
MINSPLEQFEILPILKFPFIFTNSSLILIMVFTFLYIFFCIKMKFIPTSFQQIFEIIFNTSIELSYSNIGKEGKHFIPLSFILFLFILLCNLIGIITYSFTLTSHLIVKLSLSLIIYFCFKFFVIRNNKKNFLILLLKSG